MIFPVGGVDVSIVEFLAFSLPETMELPCKVSPAAISLEGTYDIIRKQCNSTQLLERLLARKTSDDVKLLGVTDADLFIPPLSFVFGEAQFDNPASIVSTHRLQQQFYGLPEDSRLLYLRCEKEAIHELGHSFGLIHCSDYRCVMYLSYSVEDIDLKTNSFCPRCHGMLRKRTKT
ncbi:MAG: archemetzincin [Candidatus Abyssobacteria bacterium SURF_17]|jgi:archaemetzincin|uniref:Archemetzincin n=1 Tax=Candidatus Abyssobacteria bacterium SURF_17 TaxID=2093361 RepID=A0A419EPW0_9BACT|nr:MAG: archemetzincin [Candidatus Abyssubacteria bacterium SURF_17]